MRQMKTLQQTMMHILASGDACSAAAAVVAVAEVAPNQ